MHAPGCSRLVVLFVFVLVLSLAGCATVPPVSTEAGPFRWSDHTGIWVSSGYGYAVDARSGGIRLYHIAGDVCVENPPGELSAVDFFDLYRRENAQTLRLSSKLDPFEFTFSRVDALPAHCLASTPDTPPGNFHAFATYFAEHYAFFDLYGVDWVARMAEARQRVTRDTGDRDLFELMSELLGPLKDSHIKVEADIDGEKRVHDGNPGKTDRAVAAWGERNGLGSREAVGRFRRAYWFDDIRDDLLGGTGVVTGNGRIQYGMVAPDVGYIAVVSMGGFIDVEPDAAAEELVALDAAMDDAFSLFEDKGARSAILDLSLNTGGYDFVGLAIAGRFAAERRIAYTRRAGDDPFAEEFTIHVEPFDGLRFTRPVYVLTSDLTKSAGEVGALAMRALGNVTHVGERTRGAFSTILTKHLPNGWVLSLSNEVYTDPAGVVWEGQGIEPEVEMPVFDQRDPLTGHVEAVRAVVGLIERR